MRILLIVSLVALTAPAWSKAEKADFTIAALAPLTGDLASYGNAIRDGVQLATADLKIRGIKVKVLFEDTCYPTDAIKTINKLLSANQIDGIAANFCEIAIPPIAPLIERHRLPSFHTASASDRVLEAGDYIFTTNIRIQSEARLAAEYAFNSLGARTASVLYVASDFGEDYSRYFANRFHELGGRVVSSDVGSPKTRDFRAELTKIRGKNPDIVFAAHLGVVLGTLLKQMRAIGLKQDVMGIYEAEDPSVLEVAKETAEGIRFFVPEAVQATKKAKSFQERFEQQYAYQPNILASNAYDATMLLANALKNCNGQSRCVKDEIYRIKDYDGVSGKFSIDRDGGATKDFVLKTVRRQQFVRVEPQEG